MRYLQLINVLCCFGLICGCSGGGGGGEKGSSADTDGVRFIHAALDSSPRQLTVDGVSVTDYIKFGQSSGFKRIGAGTKILTLLGRSGDIETVQPTLIEDGQRVDIVLFDGLQTPRALAFKHGVASKVSATGKAARLINAVRSSAGGIVTASIAGSTVGYGASSDYKAFADVDSIILEGSARQVALPADGKLFTLVAVGESGYLTRISVIKDE